MNTSLRITIRNTSDTGGTALTPFFAGFHDGSFDLYNRGEVASAGLEALAEDGNNAVVADELRQDDADAQSTNVVGDRGPIAAGETASAMIDVDGVSNGFFSFGSMLLPSNDAFIGTGRAQQLFDSSGNFLGAQTFVFDGSNVLDAGTEVNTERDAAFINQTGPNTGETEGGVVTAHPGFNGSLGNPGGEQIILGGTNAFGDIIDPTAADFTRPGAQIATVHINAAVERVGTSGRDFFSTGGVDDLIDAGGGNDFIITRGGWDVIDAGDGRDYVNAGSGDDVISGGAGKDVLVGGTGNDQISGGEDADLILGGTGNDTLLGNAGRDTVLGGNGEDTLGGGSGDDKLYGGRDDDTLSGNGGNDSLFGDDGDDVLDGGAGTDLLSGGEGDDTLSGGTAGDRLSGGSGDDTLSGDGGSDRLVGGRGEDTLDGGAGRDLLIGGSDDDVITGGTGDDRSLGGSGDDTFVFSSGDGDDRIDDFNLRGDDTIELAVSGFTSALDVLDAAVETRGGTLLDFGSEGSIFLKGVAANSLSEDDFIFA